LWLLNDAFGGGGGGGSSGSDCLHSVSGMSVDRTSPASDETFLHWHLFNMDVTYENQCRDSGAMTKNQC